MTLRSAREVPLSALDWSFLLGADDLVVWGQASAEPGGLTASLMAARVSLRRFRAFVGISAGDSVDPANLDRVAYLSYCGTGRNRKLGNALEILPIHYADIAPTLARERPVVLLSLAPGEDSDHFSCGAGGDYLMDLLSDARLVIAEVSSRAPRTAPQLPKDAVDIVVRTDSVPLAMPSARSSDVEKAIAGHVAALIEDGSTLQIGLGSVPAAVLRALTEHRDLGIHSGMIGDEVADLAEAGVVTNARKVRDAEVSIAGVLAGTSRLMKWADGNPALMMRSTRYTHDPQVLASIERFVAINSAVEVDLTGQINAEVAAGHYVGAVGGAPAFLRGAAASRGGLPIIALPSLAGDASRIVPALSGPVSTARSDIGFVVTEYGVADLRGLSWARRRDRLIEIAHPDHRGSL